MKPSKSDIEKAKAIARSAFYCEAYEGDTNPEYTTEILVNAIAEALASERASLPESVRPALIISIEEVRCLSSRQMHEEALADLEAWKRGAS